MWMAGTGDGRRHQLILLISDLDFIRALASDQTLVRGKFLASFRPRRFSSLHRASAIDHRKIRA